MVKRLFDIVFVLAFAWLWLPILAFTALVVILVDGRPIFFLQQRAGRGGVPFSVIKFKTMLSRDGGEPVPTDGPIPDGAIERARPIAFCAARTSVCPA